MYTINYNTGITARANTIEEAKRIADAEAAYTQEPITIEDESGDEIARRHWWGVEYDENVAPCEDPICFGNYGYYDDWTN